MVQRDVVSRKIARATTWIDDAEALLANRVAHGYATLDHQRIYEEASEGVITLRRFLVAVAERAGL